MPKHSELREAVKKHLKTGKADVVSCEDFDVTMETKREGKFKISKFEKVE